MARPCLAIPLSKTDIDVKIHPRYFPVIILVTFVLFVLLGLAMGFGPQHGGGGNPRSLLDWTLTLRAGLEVVV